MDRDEFRTLFDTLALDQTLPVGESIRSGQRPTTGPTLGFSGLPGIGANETSPQLELGDTIGEGGMGVVRNARQLSLYREVAVKTLRRDRASEEAAALLMHEALVTGTLEHPNVVPIYTLAQTEYGAPLIVMKRIGGVPWTECVEHPEKAPNFDADDPLGWHLDIFAQVCLAVHFAHSRGIIHRDIKPDNVMIGEFGEVYLLDWGIAVTIDDAKAEFLVHRDQAQGVSGTPAYMAPEMTVGDPSEIGTHTDIYLLGATLYHVLTGEAPHNGQTLFEIMFEAYESAPPPFRGRVPTELADICHRAMAREPEDRWESADALRRAVLDFVRHRSSFALSDEAAERLAELETVVDFEEPGATESEVRNLYGEAHFGFVQALKVWPENATAQRGLGDLRRLMARLEIALENPGAAAGLLAELSEPDVELSEDLEDLERRLAARRQEFDRLKELQGETDLSQGAHGRAIGAFVSLGVWSILPIAADVLDKKGLMVLTPFTYLRSSLILIVFIGTLTFLLRRAFMANRANRQILKMIVIWTLFVPVFRFTAYSLDLPVRGALAMENVTYALAFTAIMLLSEHRVWFGTVVYMMAGVLGIAFRPWALEITAVANLLALGWLTYIWLDQRLLAAE